MRISLVFAVVSIWLTSSCGIKKELALMKSKNQQLTEANTDLKNKVISLKDQVSYLDEQIQIIRGSEMIDGVERNDMTDPSNLVLNAAQEMPRFSNKLTFLEFIEERMNLEEMDFEPGTVYIEMVVLEDGTLTNFKPVGASSLAQQAQAVKLLKSSSPWTPGETNGNRVKVRMVMPIIFK
ncbi:MAG: energy transducer TonB [Flavobacteriales bacterium]